MNKIYNKIILALTAVSLVACGGKDEPVNPTPTPGPEPEKGDVEVTISTTTIETKAAMTEFSANDQMNIFAKTSSSVDAPNIVDGVKATFNGTTWKMEPPVYINPNGTKNAFVYAVAPYDASYTDVAKILVDLNKQVDLLYSGAYVPASTTSPAVKLKMKHALSLMSFNIVPQNMTGKKLTKVTVNGDVVYLTGTMDASKGKITPGDKGTIVAKFDKATEAGGWKNGLPGVWTMPFNNKVTAVNVVFTIDGADYALELPEVDVKTGWQYVFRLVLTPHGLEFDPSQIETISLNVTEDQPQPFNGYGKVVLIASGSSLTSPVIDGDNAFGTVSTPTSSTPYKAAVKVEGLKAGDQVVVESWNSEGFELGSLEGIQTIDISEYE